MDKGNKKNEEQLQISGILETCLYAEDLNAAERFYSEVMGLELFIKKPGRHLFYRVPHAMLMLFNPDVTRDDNTRINGGLVPGHGATGPGHVAFNVRRSDMAKWRKHLTDCGVDIESEVDWPSGGHSIYFRDSAQNCLEVASPGIWGFGEQ